MYSTGIKHMSVSRVINVMFTLLSALLFFCYPLLRTVNLIYHLFLNLGIFILEDFHKVTGVSTHKQVRDNIRAAPEYIKELPGIQGLLSSMEEKCELEMTRL